MLSAKIVAQKPAGSVSPLLSRAQDATATVAEAPAFVVSVAADRLSLRQAPATISAATVRCNVFERDL